MNKLPVSVSQLAVSRNRVFSFQFSVPSRIVNCKPRTVNCKLASQGFTLIEMIMVIVITGIIGGMVAVFLKVPIQQYMDVSRRAELTDIADTALYHLAGEISTAVPNSLRVAGCGGIPCVEFLPTRDGGRYRANATGGAGGCAAVAGNSGGDALNFAAADTCFEIIGQPVNFAANDAIVVGSTQSDGNPPYDKTSFLNASGVVQGGVLRDYTGASGVPQTTVVMAGAQRFPAAAELSSQRFDVVDGAQQAVTYACEGTLGALDAKGNGQASLWKHWNYGFNIAQQAPVALGGSKAILANNVSGCVIDYAVANQRMGLLGVRLTLTSGGESVSLYQEIHVSNVP